MNAMSCQPIALEGDNGRPVAELARKAPSKRKRRVREESEHTKAIRALPFVQDRAPSDPPRPRCFWSVQPSGDQGVDANWKLGQHYAKLAVEVITEHDDIHLLGWIADDMCQEYTEENKRIMLGFMQELTKFVAKGAYFMKCFEDIEPGGVVSFRKRFPEEEEVAT